MRGSEWNRSVGEPTAMDLDAALAEVRVRAIPIARRRARNRSAGLALAVLLIGVAGLAAGRATAPGLRLVPDDDDGAHRIGAWSLEATNGGYQPVPGPMWRWHIATEDVIEGERLNVGEAWVEGPEGTHFDVEFHSSGAAFDGSLRATRSGDRTSVRVAGEVSQLLGRLPSNAEVKARLWRWHNAQLGPGESLIFRPFGTTGYVTTTVRITGPFAPAPTEPVRWIRADTLRAGPNERFLVSWAQRAGVRQSYGGNSALSVRAFYIPPPPSVRLTLDGFQPGEIVEAPLLGNGVLVRVPGLSESVRVTATTFLPGHQSELCIQVQSDPDVPPPQRSRGSACFSSFAPLVPVWLTLAGSGKRLQVERIRRRADAPLIEDVLQGRVAPANR